MSSLMGKPKPNNKNGKKVEMKVPKTHFVYVRVVHIYVYDILKQA